MGLQVDIVGCLSQLLLYNKHTYHSGIQQEVFLTLCLRVSGGWLCFRLQVFGSPTAALHNCYPPGSVSRFSRGHCRSKAASSTAQAPFKPLLMSYPVILICQNK